MDDNARLSAVERLAADNTREISQLRVDITDIRARQATSATKEDIANVVVQMHAALNGVLRDALNAVPGKQAALYGLIGTGGILLSAIGTFLALRH